MLESDSSRQLFDPALDQKTDSVFYAYGIMQAIQQLADQYYLQNELRGDLVKTTDKASTHLKALASFSADATNKYDSVYLYYKVINNCNYYLAHRDTTLKTGVRKVANNEYAAVATFRAWTYLQLARQYGQVPYVTEPVTTIAQINANTTMTDYQTILDSEAQMLETLKKNFTEDEITVPTFGAASNVVRSIGKLNWSNSEKYIQQRKCFMPLNVVLGDIYLEMGNYQKAAECYFQYLKYVGLYGDNFNNLSVNHIQSLQTDYSEYSPIFKNFMEWPVDYNEKENTALWEQAPEWSSIFDNNATEMAVPGDVITYIPMAVNYMMGKTTDIPAVYGYNYYGTENSSAVRTNKSFKFNCPKTEDIQIMPSQAYCDSASRAQYYFFTNLKLTVPPFNYVVRNEPLGDARAFFINQGMGADSSYVYTQKPSTGYILLYRNATVWLHLAEAINRMGYPDAAFAVLKNGLHSGLKEFLYEEVYQTDENGELVKDTDGNPVLDMTQSHIDDSYYLTPKSYDMLCTTLPFLAQANANIFKNGATKYFTGIHGHGCGAIESRFSTYKYSTVLKAKIDDIYEKFGFTKPAEYSQDDYINAMEDLLCDEYAMEFAFEGTRFSDLRRLALHKNQSGLYGGGFGDKWLSRMLQNNRAGITTQNCYLPYK
jgi:hypothetical protein